MSFIFLWQHFFNNCFPIFRQLNDLKLGMAQNCHCCMHCYVIGARKWVTVLWFFRAREACLLIKIIFGSGLFRFHICLACIIIFYLYFSYFILFAIVTANIAGSWILTQSLNLQNAPQITPSQQPIITTQPQPHKAQIVNPPQQQQIVVATQKQPPALISTSISSSTNQMVTSNPQLIQGNQQLLQGNQQIIAVSNNQPIIMSAPMKSGVHRVVQNVQQPQRSPVVTNVQTSSQPSVVHSEVKPSVIQTNTVSTLII